MKKIEYLFLLLMILQSCNNTDQAVSSGLKVDSKDSLTINQVINFNLIEYPGVFLKSEGLEEWQDFKKLHESLKRLSDLNLRDVQVDLLALSGRLKEVSKKTLPGTLEVPQIRSRLKVVEMQAQKSRYFTQYYREDSLIPSLNKLYESYNALVSRMTSLKAENAAVSQKIIEKN
tara:strand:- start:1269 stop:1790 length:522 start_codon:yes stop_codon:yes gene_type:complete